MENLESMTAALEVGPRDDEDLSEEIDWSKYKAHNIYEGSDSEDGRMINEALKNRPRVLRPPGIPNIIPPQHSVPSVKESVGEVREYDLQLGQVAAQGEGFCSWNLVKSYPLNYIGSGNRDRVNEGFFDKGKVCERDWDFFYIYPSTKKTQQPLFLVPTKQFKQFLDDINWEIDTKLRIPGGPSQCNFQITFPNDGNPQPRYLGRSTDQEMAESLKMNAPPSYYKLEGESKQPKPSDRSLEAFRAKIQLMEQNAKAKKSASKEKQKAERIAKSKRWNHSIKRVQRYLGLRESQQDHDAKLKATVDPEILRQAWGAEHESVIAAKNEMRRIQFDPTKPAPYNLDGSVVFVCVDLEAYERNTSLVTEIGIATLDTKDLEGVAPGLGGLNWRGLIRARHFRIHEYRNLNNKDFVAGCADKFEFGESEFIMLKDAPNVIASCFKHPFSKPSEKANDQVPKRNIVLVGHDVNSDIKFLRTIGYDVFNLSTLQEVADTATMWQYVTRVTSPRKLALILSELGITGWNLHNAGNDAVYTLQAMVGIAIKHLEERTKEPEEKEAEKDAKLAEAVKEVTETVLESQQGWSSEGENSDGGVALRPVPSPPRDNVNWQARGGSNQGRGDFNQWRGGSNQGRGSSNYGRGGRGSYGGSSQGSHYERGAW